MEIRPEWAYQAVGKCLGTRSWCRSISSSAWLLYLADTALAECIQVAVVGRTRSKKTFRPWSGPRRSHISLPEEHLCFCPILCGDGDSMKVDQRPPGHYIIGTFQVGKLPRNSLGQSHVLNCASTDLWSLISSNRPAISIDFC